MSGADMTAPTQLQPADAKHPCPKMRLAGRQNYLPDEFCMAST